MNELDNSLDAGTRLMCFDAIYHCCYGMCGQESHRISAKEIWYDEQRGDILIFPIGIKLISNT